MSFPITTGQLTVGTEPVQIDGMSINPFRLYVHNMDTTKSLYVGGADLTLANGFAIDKLSVQDFELFPDQQLFVVSENGNHLISWMRVPV